MDLLDDSAFMLGFSGVADLVILTSSVDNFFVFKIDLMGFLGEVKFL